MLQGQRPNLQAAWVSSNSAPFTFSKSTFLAFQQKARTNKFLRELVLKSFNSQFYSAEKEQKLEQHVFEHIQNTMSCEF